MFDNHSTYWVGSQAPRCWVALALGLLLFTGAPAGGQESEASLESRLEAYDRSNLARYLNDFLVDARYNDVLNRITARVLPHVDEVFGKPSSKVVLSVHLSNTGFNAIAFHRLIILDSLLLDGLKRYAQSIVVNGCSTNAYAEQLAHFLAGVQVNHTTIRPGKEFDPRNPYRIPAPLGLTDELDKLSDAVFEEMLAAWLCHEMSHALLGHAREKLRKAQAYSLQLEHQSVPPEAAAILIQRYLSYDLGPEKEMEAERFGARLARRAGYSREGFRRTLLLVKQIEEISGRALETRQSGWPQSHTARSHPYADARWQVVQEVFAQKNL